MGGSNPACRQGKTKMKSRRLAIISAAAILAGSAMPALAQDVPDIAESPDIVESHVLPPVPETPGAAPMPVAPAYPADYQRARAEWIDTCVARYRGEKKRDGNGGLIGGLIGPAAVQRYMKSLRIGGCPCVKSPGPPPSFKKSGLILVKHNRAAQRKRPPGHRRTALFQNSGASRAGLPVKISCKQPEP